MNKTKSPSPWLMKKPGKIMIMFTYALIISFFIIGVVSVLSFKSKITEIYMIQKETELDGAIALIEEMIEDLGEYNYAVWDLWKNHTDELKIVYDDVDYEDKLQEEILLRTGNSVKYLLSRFDEQDYNTQLDIASFYYNHYLNMFDYQKASLDAKYFFILTPEEGETWDIIFSAKTPDEVRGENGEFFFLLGKKFEYDKEKYEPLYRAYESEGFQVLEQDVTEENNSNRKILYAPIIHKNKTIAVLAVSYDKKDVSKWIDREIRNKVIEVAIFFLAVLIVLWYIIRRNIIFPISKTKDAIEDFMDRKDSEKLSGDLLPLQVNDEIGDLCRKLSEMGGELTRYISDITEMAVKEEKVKSEMELAARIQQSILDKNEISFPKSWNIDLYANMKPSKNVGGDFYDYSVLDEDHLCLVAGDVSGKGVPASLYMMICMVLFNNEMTYQKEPADILEAVNTKLLQYIDLKMMATAWVGVYEVSTGTLKMGNAGHENPIIIRKDDTIEVVEEKHNIVLGMMEDIKYRQYDVKLNKGDMFIIYSDGVPEACASDGRMLGMSGFLEILRDYCALAKEEGREKNSADLEGFIEKAAIDYQKGVDQSDDITVMVLKSDTGTVLLPRGRF